MASGEEGRAERCPSLTLRTGRLHEADICSEHEAQLVPSPSIEEVDITPELKRRLSRRFAHLARATKDSQISAAPIEHRLHSTDAQARKARDIVRRMAEDVLQDEGVERWMGKGSQVQD
jgi:hypothetical protein